MRCPSCGDLLRSAGSENATRRCGACGRTLGTPVIDLVPRHEVVEADLHQRSRRIAQDALEWARLLGPIVDIDAVSPALATQATRLARLAEGDEEVLADARIAARNARLPESVAAGVLLSEAMRRCAAVAT